MVDIQFHRSNMSAILLTETSYWSTVLSFLAQQYFTDSHATCILWHSSFNVRLEAQFPVFVMEPESWHNMEENTDYEKKRIELDSLNIAHNEWILRLTLAIDQAHCESFIAFQGYIPKFAHAFYNASIYATWRSTRNRFIFAYTDELLSETSDPDSLFNDYIFQDQPNILVIKAEFLNSSIFELKTNRFVGPRNFDKKSLPADLYTFQRYDAQLQRIIWNTGIDISTKIQDLQGREIVIGLFTYKPFMLLDYERQPKVFDRAINSSEVFIDGTEVRTMLIFCELHNCTIQAVSTGQYNWGDIYENYTGIGLMGMVLDRTTDYGIGGFYVWYEAYLRMEMTLFLGRSGVTCLVPAPRPIINWALPLRPFRATLWLCVVICLVLECLALTCTRKYEHSSSHPRNWQKSFSFGCVSTLKLFVNQSTSYKTTSYALRTVLLASFMIDIILTTVYGGGLAAILTLPKLEEAADSRQRLYSHKLIWAATSPAWISIFDADSVEPVLLGLFENFRVYDETAIATKSRSEQIGFVVERMQFGHLANDEMIPDDALPRLKLMVDDIYFVNTVAYVPRLWALLDAHNQFILNWHSSGLDKYWEWKIAAEYMNAHRQNQMSGSQILSHDIGPVKLGIDNFIGLTLLWCFGMTCSLLAFIIELWCGKIK